MAETGACLSPTDMKVNKVHSLIRKKTERIFNAAIKAVSPETAIKNNLSLSKSGVLKTPLRRYNLNGYNNVFVIGGGKGVSPMARAVEGLLGRRITSGVVVTKYGHSLGILKHIREMEGAHPVPDGKSVKGAEAVLDIAARAGKGDLVICLLTGGASALLSAPIKGVTLRDKKKMTKLLLECGANIQEINTVRKHISQIKGGLLARAIHPAETLTLIVSDVVGDDLSTIASGPTVPDGTTFKDALSILKKYGLLSKVPKSIVRYLKAAKGETPRRGAKCFTGSETVLVATNRLALSAAKEEAKKLGFNTILLTSTLSGTAEGAAAFVSSVMGEIKETGNPIKRPACVLMGGETTIKVTGGGLGGRNQELALEAALHLEGIEGVGLLSVGTDGTDGPTDAAGAFVDGDTVMRARKKRLNSEDYIKRNDSYNFFKSEGGLFITGPTRTNVMDLIIGIVT